MGGRRAVVSRNCSSASSRRPAAVQARRQQGLEAGSLLRRAVAPTERSPRRPGSASPARDREAARPGHCPGRTSARLMRAVRPRRDAASASRGQLFRARRGWLPAGRGRKKLADASASSEHQQDSGDPKPPGAQATNSAEHQTHHSPSVNHLPVTDNIQSHCLTPQARTQAISTKGSATAKCRALTYRMAQKKTPGSFLPGVLEVISRSGSEVALNANVERHGVLVLELVGRWSASGRCRPAMARYPVHL